MKDKNSLATLWTKLDGEKDLDRYRQYAQWTLPHICPPLGSEDRELQGTVDSTGSRAVNHLANKLIMTLYRPGQPFFRLLVQNDQMEELKQSAEQGDAQATEVIQALDQTLIAKEKQALVELDYNSYRTEATQAAKGLIITGNALMYHPPNGKAQTYSVKDYCVQRDLSGNVLCILTRDMRSFDTFDKEVQDQLKTDKTKRYGDDHSDTEDVTLYTKIELNRDTTKYDLTQFADNVKLDVEASWSQEDLPWIVLAWNLIRGEDYGRGLVEDYAGAFHALNVLTNAEVEIAGMAADIKHLVDPASILDVSELNRSKSGSYHAGKEGDISTVQLDKLSDLQLVEMAIERYTRQISQAFLLNSSVQRQAERVTAEEIRYMAQELEMSHGGIYSRFADEWQLVTARLILRRVGLSIGKSKLIYPQILTGLASLSRSGDMENLHMLLADLAALQQVPEEFRAAISPSRYLEFAASRRGVEYEKFAKTQQEIQQEQMQAQAAQQQQMQAQAGMNITEEAGKQIVQEE